MGKIILDITAPPDGFITRPNWVFIGEMGNIAPQYPKAGLLNEINIHLAPVLFCRGIQLFDDAGFEPQHWKKSAYVSLLA